jgi:peptide/nickel transport system ATP-binding protein
MAGSGNAHLRDDEDVVLRVEGLVVEYKIDRSHTLQAVSDVSFDIRRGETLGLVGESGCGKSSTARAVLMLERPRQGIIMFEGQELTSLSARARRKIRSRLQLIFQNPKSSLNARRKVKDIVAEGLEINHAPRPFEQRVNDALLSVGLDPGAIGERRPTELSGGQSQRVAIARALVLNPAVIVCDESVSALDVTIQAQILNLLDDMKSRYHLTLLFIAHDLAVVKNISDRVAVMYLGKLCEIADSDDLYLNPQHPYTQALLSAIPVPDPVAPEVPMAATGELPSQLDPPSGCRFRTRCPRATPLCAVEAPVIRPTSAGHYVACHFPGADKLAAATPKAATAEPD